MNLSFEIVVEQEVFIMATPKFDMAHLQSERDVLVSSTEIIKTLNKDVDLDACFRAWQRLYLKQGNFDHQFVPSECFTTLPYCLNSYNPAHHFYDRCNYYDNTSIVGWTSKKFQ